MVGFTLALAGCGSVPLTGGRPYPPDFDGYGYPRAMVAVQTSGTTTSGALQLIDVKHDTVNNQQDTVHNYSIKGFNGAYPLTIQDFPGSTEAYVYSNGTPPTNTNASFIPVDTATDSAGGAIPGVTLPAPGGFPQGVGGVYISPDFQFVYAGSPETNGGYFTVVRLVDDYITRIPEPAVGKISLSPGGQTVLFFANNANENSNNLFQVVGIGQNSTYDCDQQILLKNATLGYDKPVNALFSADGTSTYILNCGPECGGTTSSVITLNTGDLLNAGNAGYTGQLGCNIAQAHTVAPATLAPTNTIAVPGGATVALQAGNTLFVAGQQLQSSGYFGGFLTIIDLTSGAITGTYPIGDGYHFRMRLGDNNDTLWIAAQLCQSGVQSVTGGITGCVTMVPLTATGADGSYTTTASSIVIEPAHGDASGIAPIIGYNKTYTVEGPNIYIYSNADGSQISNYYVQVTGTPKDIAFIDGSTITGP
jgi:hypothetical protein